MLKTTQLKGWLPAIVCIYLEMKSGIFLKFNTPNKWFLMTFRTVFGTQSSKRRENPSPFFYHREIQTRRMKNKRMFKKKVTSLIYLPFKEHTKGRKALLGANGHGNTCFWCFCLFWKDYLLLKYLIQRILGMFIYLNPTNQWGILIHGITLYGANPYNLCQLYLTRAKTT